MKKKMLIGLVMGFFMLGIVGGANAATVFLDNFEDGDTSGWLTGATNGIGSIGVELHNSSQMAFVQQSGSGIHSLSIDFSYLANETLSFDMHAVALAAPSTATSTGHASSGINLSFLNAFNTEIGSASLVNTTNPGALGSNDSLIDNQQHNYRALLSDYAALSGLGATDPISKFSLTYFATGQTNFFGARSDATVWFDNVTVSDTNPVPLPGAIWLLGSGLISLGAFRKKKK